MYPKTLTLPRPLPPLHSQLSLAGNGMGDDGAKALAAALGQGAAPLLEALLLNSNAIGDRGLMALATAMADRRVPHLRILRWGLLNPSPNPNPNPKLLLNSNAIGDRGLMALATAMADRRVPHLRILRWGLLENAGGGLNGCPQAERQSQHRRRGRQGAVQRAQRHQARAGGGALSHHACQCNATVGALTAEAECQKGWCQSVRPWLSVLGYERTVVRA
jgi:hypothetical protein